MSWFRAESEVLASQMLSPNSEWMAKEEYTRRSSQESNSNWNLELGAGVGGGQNCLGKNCRMDGKRRAKEESRRRSQGQLKHPSQQRALLD